MSVFQPVMFSGSLNSIVHDFAAAHDLSDAALADWLEIPPDRLPELAGMQTPAPYTKTFHQDCRAIVVATGCDAWSLGVVLLWTMGKR
jgi:hypothetical protein